MEGPTWTGVFEKAVDNYEDKWAKMLEIHMGWMING